MSSSPRSSLVVEPGPATTRWWTAGITCVIGRWEEQGTVQAWSSTPRRSGAGWSLRRAPVAQTRKFTTSSGATMQSAPQPVVATGSQFPHAPASPKAFERRACDQNSRDVIRGRSGACVATCDSVNSPETSEPATATWKLAGRGECGTVCMSGIRRPEHIGWDDPRRGADQAELLDHR